MYGAGDQNRTGISCLEGKDNNHYMTPASEWLDLHQQPLRPMRNGITTFPTLRNNLYLTTIPPDFTLDILKRCNLVLGYDVFTHLCNFIGWTKNSISI